ncbi:general transcription factor II-I repeat domain-containing protein 2-like [Palaemon carinicauda]|uniref:general transcription factor II-I repeat domain-containing protein 2-like n=1 Tax=Palaemon carinicauda TaxID=392227 RepID=UPI0035B60568
MEYGDLILYCEVRWLSRGPVLSRFWKLKNIVHDFLKEKGELPEENALLCDEKWMFDLAFLVDITSHLNDLNSKLQGKNKLFPSLVNDISAFKMKLKLSISQLENKDLSQFPHLKEQSECAEDNINFTEYIEKIILLQEAFDIRFSDFSEEDCMLAFINPFSLTENNILKMPSNIQMELIDLKANSVLKCKLNELFSLPSASEMLNFWRSLPGEHFPELKKFAQSYACRFGTTYRCEQEFSSMKMIKNKPRSRLSDSNLKNSLLLSVTNLTLNITDLDPQVCNICCTLVTEGFVDPKSIESRDAARKKLRKWIRGFQKNSLRPHLLNDRMRSLLFPKVSREIVVPRPRFTPPCVQISIDTDLREALQSMNIH